MFLKYFVILGSWNTYIEVTSNCKHYQQNFDFLDKNQNFEILFQNSIKKLVKKPWEIRYGTSLKKDEKKHVLKYNFVILGPWNIALT